ncbi:MAG: hypothetical protein P9C48_12630 [Defluviicoccus sp.]|nr:hypothetical protein [Defluviicoccus sp.]MDG4609965.1 hypothetical protein [Defluviicoccus sp.]
MNQHDLFAETPEPAWRPNPEKVRSRLRRILSEARASATLPWDAARLSLYRTIFPDMARWLPIDEAEALQNEFNAELARLCTK